MALRVHNFIAFHRHWNCPLDGPAEWLLRRQPPWLQHAVIERGPCTDEAGAGNPSAIVVRRVMALRGWFKLPKDSNVYSYHLRQGGKQIVSICSR